MQRPLTFLPILCRTDITKASQAPPGTEQAHSFVSDGATAGQSIGYRFDPVRSIGS
jgi:hypothetical protein